jgi:NDP-sugar pyrophosphorylase family protein
MSYGIAEIIVNVHHFADQIIQAINENKGWGANITISDETDEVLETGGGLLRAAQYFENEESWLVMNADILTNLDLHTMIAADESFALKAEGELVATLAVTERTSSRNLIFNATGEEKWANPLRDSNTAVPKAFSGIQIVHASFLKEVQLRGKFSLIDAYLQLAQHFAIHYFDHSDGVLLDVGKPESIEKAATIFK